MLHFETPTYVCSPHSSTRNNTCLLPTKKIGVILVLTAVITGNYEVQTLSSAVMTQTVYCCNQHILIETTNSHNNVLFGCAEVDAGVDSSQQLRHNMQPSVKTLPDESLAGTGSAPTLPMPTKPKLQAAVPTAQPGSDAAQSQRPPTSPESASQLTESAETDPVSGRTLPESSVIASEPAEALYELSAAMGSTVVVPESAWAPLEGSAPKAQPAVVQQEPAGALVEPAVLPREPAVVADKPTMAPHEPAVVLLEPVSEPAVADTEAVLEPTAATAGSEMSINEVAPEAATMGTHAMKHSQEGQQATQQRLQQISTSWQDQVHPRAEHELLQTSGELCQKPASASPASMATCEKTVQKSVLSAAEPVFEFC